MGVGIAELRESLSGYAAGFDAALLSAAEAEAVVEEASRIEKIAANLKGLAAARLAEVGSWRAEGDRTAAHQLARRTGTSVVQAASVIETARRLGALPETAAAARRGELSAEQAAAIVDAVGADPGPSTNCWRRPAARLWPSCANNAPGPRPPVASTPKPAAGASTNAGRCGPSPTPRASGTSTAATTPKSGPASWPPSIPSARRSSARPAPKAATSRPRPTPPTPSPKWPANRPLAKHR